MYLLVKMVIFQPAMFVYQRVGGETSNICCFHPYLGKMGRFPTWRAHIFQMGGSTTNQICFVFVAPIPGMPEITWPNSNQNQGSCGGFKLFTAINLLGKTEIRLVKMKLNLIPAIDSTSNLFKQNPSCRLCKSLTPFEASFTAFIWQWNMTTIK